MLQFLNTALVTAPGTRTNGKIINGTCYIYVNEAKNFNDAIEFCKQIGPARLFEPRYDIYSDFFDIDFELIWIGINVNTEDKYVYVSNGEKATPVTTPIDTSFILSQSYKSAVVGNNYLSYSDCTNGNCTFCIDDVCNDFNCVAGKFYSRVYREKLCQYYWCNAGFGLTSTQSIQACDSALPFICETIS